MGPDVEIYHNKLKPMTKIDAKPTHIFAEIFLRSGQLNIPKTTFTIFQACSGNTYKKAMIKIIESINSVSNFSFLMPVTSF